MIDITLIEQQITNNLEAFNQHVENVQSCEYHLTIAPDSGVKAELNKRIKMYKRMMKNHLLQAQSLSQQLKSYNEEAK
jgi:hypothetical protein